MAEGLGDIQAIYRRFNGHKYFTSLDLASGFYQLKIAEEDKHKTAFRDAHGTLCEFNRCGFGLKILPAVFASCVAKALGPLKGHGVENWLDDILIYSHTFEEHVAMLRQVLDALLAGGFSIDFAKSKWVMPSQEFVGIVFDHHGIRPAPSKLDAVAKLTQPSNVEELRAFLGMTGYLRQSVERGSILAAPLTNIFRNKSFSSKRARKSKTPWGQEHQQAFDSLKHAFASPRILAFPDWVCPFSLHTDASEIGAGVILTQEQSGESGVIAFASHRWSRTDARRGPTERELMAALFGIDHFRVYLTGRQFTLVTDCTTLLWLFRSRGLNSKLFR